MPDPKLASVLSFAVDLDKTLTKTILRDLFVTEDKNAHVFEVKLTRSGVDVDLTGATVTGYFMRYKDQISVPLTGSVQNNTARIALDASCYTMRTMFSLTVCVESGQERHAVFLGEGQMVRNRSDSITDPDNVIPSVADILAQYGLMKEGTEAANAAAQSANAAASSANTAAGKANTAASSANTAAGRAENAAQNWESGTAANALRLGGVEASNYALKAPNNYAYDGRDLSAIFTAAQLHTAVAAGDFTNIRVGDYWPITLNGTIYDYAGAVEKTLSNASIKLEVAGVNFYRQYGDTAVPNHLLFCSRDLLPWTLMFRSENTTWYDAEATNPWLGSHLYQTLNNPSNGLLPLVAATDIGAYIYAGPNGNGMRFLGETKGPTATTATNWAWADRGKLFLPSEREVWGGDTWSEHSYGGGLALQWPIFAGTMRHIIKGLGNGGSRDSWWCCSSNAGSSGHICYVLNGGLPDRYGATSTWVGAPVCFMFV